MAAGRRQESGFNPPDEDRQVAHWKLIVGLGNPGPAYRGTRHNIGFEVLDLLAEHMGEAIRTKQFGGLTAQGRLDDQRIVLLKPQQFMNRSGQVVATAAGFYKLSPTSILVITDDVALEPGRIRLRASGSAGGHNGLADIIEKLGTQQFARLRVGVGPSDGRDLADHVLSRPDPEQRRRIEEALVRARDAALCWVREGASKAMTRFNTRASEPEP
jgi:PTH1 family peptidyl-tRNA hydrolase